ncbi:MFS transporter [Nocardiopsis alba]|uniref:MFS transporter n=1 Tax=Nocardiopsis alba TaxID=53437 RepID=UPI0033B855CD
MSSHALRSGAPWYLALVAFAVGTDDLVIAGLLPAIARDLDIGVAAAGQAVTVFSITYAVAAPVLAVATARLPRRALLLTGLALFACVNLATALVPGYASLLVMRVVAALIAAVLTPVAFSMAARLVAPEHTGRAVGTVAAGLTVSLFLGVPIGSLLGSLFGWRATFLAVALFTGVVLAIAASRLPALDGAPEAGLRHQLGSLGRPAILTCVLGTVMGASGGFMVYTYIAPLTRDLTGAGGVALAPLIAVVGAAGAVGTMVCGRATDRWGADRVLLVSFAGMIATSLTLAALGYLGGGAVPVWTLAIVLALWGFAAWGFAAPMSARLLGLAGEEGTEALALNTGGLYVGTAVAGALGGVVVTSQGGAGVAATATAIGLLAFVAMALSVRRFPTSTQVGTVREDTLS